MDKSNWFTSEHNSSSTWPVTHNNPLDRFSCSIADDIIGELEHLIQCYNDNFLNFNKPELTLKLLSRISLLGCLCNYSSIYFNYLDKLSHILELRNSKLSGMHYSVEHLTDLLCNLHDDKFVISYLSLCCWSELFDFESAYKSNTLSESDVPVVLRLLSKCSGFKSEQFYSLNCIIASVSFMYTGSYISGHKHSDFFTFCSDHIGCKEVLTLQSVVYHFNDFSDPSDLIKFDSVLRDINKIFKLVHDTDLTVFVCGLMISYRPSWEYYRTVNKTPKGSRLECVKRLLNLY